MELTLSIGDAASLTRRRLRWYPSFERNSFSHARARARAYHARPEMERFAEVATSMDVYTRFSRVAKNTITDAI